MYRTHTCTELSIDDIGNHVILSGWVHKRRDLGDLIFLDLRDRSGLMQIVFDSKTAEKEHKIAETIRSEYVIKVEGIVRKRDDGSINPNLKTGEIEVEIKNIEILNKAKTTPFSVRRYKINV